MGEEDIEGDNGPDSDIEVVPTLCTRSSQGRKRTRASHKASSSFGTGSKKANIASSASTEL